MRASHYIPSLMRGVILPGCVVLSLGGARAQDAAQIGAASANAWQYQDWLDSSSSSETFKATPVQVGNDPFTVLSTGNLWREKEAAIDTRRLDDGLSLSCETSTATLEEDPADTSRSQKIGVQFQPVEEFTLRGDLHNSANDAPLPASSTLTSGAGFSVEGQLPLRAVLTLGLQTDYTNADAPSGWGSQTNACDAQWKQAIGQLPLTAILKGHYEGTSTGGAPPTSLPSLEQSFVWKPLQDTTFQAGLRQQQYQEYPGVDHQLNEALFADWSQQVLDNVSWHSYAEVLNSKGLLDQAPAAPIASGANGTPQATTPGSNASVTSSLPLSIDDQTLTFSTGPSFKLEKDISASVEYSNRWDKNPAPGSTGEEQRVSVSLKGTF